MKFINLFILVFFLSGMECLKAQKNDIFFSNRFVNLKGAAGVTVIKNATPDTISLDGKFFGSLPYTEHSFAIKLAPGQQDSVVFQFNYPDFILINNSFRIFNGPNKKVTCIIKSLKTRVISIDFTGDLNTENLYYLNYNNFLGNYDKESRPYYNSGDRIKDFNQFPAIADSITQARLDFLAKYKEKLPDWFKKHEFWRLTYNGIMRKYNVLFSKEFYGGKPIPVNASYYSFEKDLQQGDKGMVLNSDYLGAMDFYLLRQSKRLPKSAPDVIIKVIDSLYHSTDEGDVLKMRRLGIIFTSSKDKYDTVLAITNFKNLDNKITIDSLIQTKLGLPKVGGKAPDFTLTDINGKELTLSAYAGRPIIINFWAVWCGPCIAEFPQENKLYQQYKDKGLVVINVCVDSDTERWKAISERDKLQMVNLFADAAQYKALKAKYNIGALPRSVFIKKDFKVDANYFQRASLLYHGYIENLLKN